MTAASAVRLVVKPAVFVTALVPALLLGAAALEWYGDLGANPIDKITDVTGIWTLRFVLLTLAVTPLRRVTGWNVLVRLRRMLGLFAFFYGTLHFSTWLVLDQFFAWQFILADIAKRPYITVGFIGFVLMIPLALTSTAGWIRRLGGKRWNWLHRLVYLTGIAGVIHYWWLVKVVTASQITYMAILVVLLGARVWFALERKSGVARRAAPHPNPVPDFAKATSGAEALAKAPAGGERGIE